uniref:Uncharacterized protein n=1 Tax=Anopheles atroparvus TaxID=41427 RepID=A0AAG5DHF8_ANOAO
LKESANDDRNAAAFNERTRTFCRLMNSGKVKK